MRRRAFISVFGAAAAAWPLASRAQQTDQMRRIGALMGWSDNDPVNRSYFAAAVQRLAQLGWVEGRNLLSTTCPGQGEHHGVYQYRSRDGWQVGRLDH